MGGGEPSGARFAVWAWVVGGAAGRVGGVGGAERRGRGVFFVAVLLVANGRCAFGAVGTRPRRILAGVTVLSRSVRVG